MRAPSEPPAQLVNIGQNRHVVLASPHRRSGSARTLAIGPVKLQISQRPRVPSPSSGGLGPDTTGPGPSVTILAR